MISMDTSPTSDSSVQQALLTTTRLPTPNGLLSDAILSVLQANPLLGQVPHKGDGTWVDFHGTVFSGSHTITIEIPQADLHTNLPGWLIQVISAGVAFVTGALAAAICIATFTGGSP